MPLAAGDGGKLSCRTIVSRSLHSTTENATDDVNSLSWAHVMGPFLLWREVWELHSRVYEGQKRGKTPEAGDLFRIFMIYALASIMPYRNGLQQQHPEGYYMGALQYLDSSFLTRGMRSLEDLLLICRYGIYENIRKPPRSLLRHLSDLNISRDINMGHRATRWPSLYRA